MYLSVVIPLLFRFDSFLLTCSLPLRLPLVVLSYRIIRFFLIVSSESLVLSLGTKIQKTKVNINIKLIRRRTDRIEQGRQIDR